MKLKTNVHSYQSWNADAKHALGLYRVLGREMGFWPLECNSISSILRIIFVTITQLLMSSTLTYLLISKKKCGGVTDIVDVLSLISCGFMSILKVIIPRIHQKKMKEIIESAIKDWSHIVDEKSRETMLRFANLGRTVFIIQMSGAYATGFPLIVSRIPFITSLWNDKFNGTLASQQVPIGPSCWVSPDISTISYVSYYTLQSIQLIVVCTAHIGADVYFFGIAMHVCGQFELLYTQLQKLDGSLTAIKQTAMLKKFVKRHTHLLKLANFFEDTYNIIILAQVGEDILLTCISGIVLLMVAKYGQPIIIIGLVVRIYLVYIQLFLYSYVGEQLSSSSEKLQVAVYNTSWYKMQRHIVKDMIFIMARNNYPYNLTAGKMYSMNYSNFKNIIRAMGSYFSILRLMFIDE